MKILLFLLLVIVLAASAGHKKEFDTTYPDNQLEESSVQRPEIVQEDNDLSNLNSSSQAYHQLHQRYSSNQPVASTSSEDEEARLQQAAVKTDLDRLEYFIHQMNLSALIIFIIIFVFTDI